MSEDNKGLGVLGTIGAIGFQLFVPEPIQWGLQLGVWGLSTGLEIKQKKEHEKKIQHLNSLVNTGKFDEAERFVRELNLPYVAEQSVLDQLAEMHRQHEAQMSRIREWNQKINSLMASGQFNEAIRFVESLDLPQEQKTKIVASLRDTMSRHEWGQKLDAFVKQGQFNEAMQLIKSANLPKDEKKKMIVQIEDMIHRREWDQKLKSLMAQGQFDKAIRFVESPKVSPNEKQQIIASIQARVHSLQWEQTLNALLAQGRVNDAIKLVESSNLPQEQKAKIVESIQNMNQRPQEGMQQINQWMATVTQLIAAGKVEDAQRYITSLPIPDEAKTAILLKVMFLIVLCQLCIRVNFSGMSGCSPGRGGMFVDRQRPRQA